MCGIVAIFSRSGHVDGQLLTVMTRTLAHRGPDGQGEFVDPSGLVGLGHTRLSVIDLAGGQQPLFNETRSICAVVAGEFYGYEAVRADLMARGHVFATASDSEILVHLYEEYGPECIHHLRGEFSFCLWDAEAKELMVARDRFGVKPVFYAENESTLIVASEIKALFAAGLQARWNHASVLAQFFLCLPTESTLFAGIHQLPPGHTLRVSRHGTCVTRYWDLDYPVQVDQRTSTPEETHIERLRNALDDAVRIRLRADVPCAFFLSGGIDSSAVVGLARQHMEQAPSVFTVCFNEQTMNEHDAALRTANHIGAKFNPITVSRSDIATHFIETIRSGEMVALNGHVVARFIHSSAVHKAGYKVALSGSGSDDILGGYPAMRQDLLEYERRDEVEPDLPEILRGVHQQLGFTPSWMRKLAVDRSLFFLLLAPEMLALFDTRNPYTAFVEAAPYSDQLHGRHPVLQSAYLWDRAFLANYELMAERLEMVHGIEVRLPFLDGRVFDVARTLPVNLLVRGQREKYALREAIRPFVADSVYRRRKHSFTAPLSTLDPDSELLLLLQDTLRSRRFQECSVFDTQAVTKFLDNLDVLPDRARVASDAVATILLSWALLAEVYSVC